MELFLTVLFWLYLFSVIISVVDLSFGKFPKTSTSTQGTRVFALLVQLAIFVWICKLKGIL